MMLLWVIIFFPLLNLIGIALAAGSIAFMTMDCATKASSQPTYADALTAMADEATSFQSTGLMKFLNLQPNGGYTNCGMDLFVKAENYRNGNTTDYGPNTPVPPPLDPMTFVYEYCAESKFSVSPWVMMSGVPFLGQVPGLGKPVVLTFNVERSVEHPNGLADGNTNSATNSGGGVGSATPPAINNTTSANLLPPLDGSEWNHPNIYQLIEQAGETVVATDVFIVPANNPNPTMSQVSVNQENNLWFAFRSDGMWTTSPTDPTVNADGYATSTDNGTLKDANGKPFKYALLVGKLTNSPYFEIGQQLTMPAPGTGQLGALCCDYEGMYDNNTGEQIVRVVVTVKK